MCCSSRGPKSDIQHPYEDRQLSVTPVPEDLMLSSGLRGGCTYVVQRNAVKTSIHMMIDRQKDRQKFTAKTGIFKPVKIALGRPSQEDCQEFNPSLDPVSNICIFYIITYYNKKYSNQAFIWSCL